MEHAKIALLGLSLGLNEGCNASEAKPPVEDASALIDKQERIIRDAMVRVCEVKVEGSFDDDSFPHGSLGIEGVSINDQVRGYGRGGVSLAYINQKPAPGCLDGQIPRLLADYLDRGMIHIWANWGPGYYSTEFQTEGYQPQFITIPKFLQEMAQADRAFYEQHEDEEEGIDYVDPMLTFRLDQSNEPLFAVPIVDGKKVGRGFLETAGYVQDRLNENDDTTSNFTIRLETRQMTGIYETSLETLAAQMEGFEYTPPLCNVTTLLTHVGTQ